MVVTKVSEHMGVGPGDADAGGLGELVQAAGGRMPVHPGTAAVEQDRPARAVPDRPGRGPARPRAAAAPGRPSSPSFRARLSLGVVSAGQVGFGVPLGVLPMSSFGGVAVQAEDAAELVLDGGRVSEHAVRARHREAASTCIWRHEDTGWPGV